MSVIFPAGTSNKMSAFSSPALKKIAQFEEIEVEEKPAEVSGFGEEAPEGDTGFEEAPVSDITEVEDSNPAFDAIRSLPGFEDEVAEIDALESETPVAEGGIAGNVAKIEDAANQIADAAKQISQSVSKTPSADAACPCADGSAEVAVVDIPSNLEKPETEECAVCGDEIPAGLDKDEGECCKDEGEKKDDGEKKDETPEEEKIEKEGDMKKTKRTAKRKPPA